ncbi:MAG: hypothetical protein HY236_11000 [Acidobacteria bacterium]|nr:hypothetical protein [Acidobacteriota bacterium]
MISLTERRRYAALLGIFLALAGAAAYWRIWREKQDPHALFRRLPAENILLAYLDLGRLRHASVLAPLLRARVEPDPDYAAFVRKTGFDYQRDLDAAAICYLSDRVYILARGRFDPARLRQYALDQGGSCLGSGLERPCRIPADRPQRKISFYLMSPGVLALATAPEPDAVLQLTSTPEPGAEPLAQDVAENEPAALLWLTAAPASLDRVLGRSSFFSPNLTLFTKALANSQRAYLSLTDRAGKLELALRAMCGSEAQAGELRRLLQGLNDLISGVLRGARARNPPSEWEKVLGSAVIDQKRDTVRAAWILDQTALESLGREASR